jgi:transcriptional regulator with XRE-family HTH domain
VHIEADVLGEIVKAARINKGLTQDELAEIAGIGLRHMVGIENEGAYPSYEVLHKLIRELCIPADSIFYPPMCPDDYRREYLIRLRGQCNDRDIRTIIALVESLAGKDKDA